MKTIKDEMLVIIPYVNDCQGSELETALYGWNTFCKSPFRLIVIGDWSPVIEGNAEFVEFERTPEIKGQYRPNIDVARKLDYIYEKFHEEYDHFVLANDDEYAIRDFTYEYFLPLYKLQDSFMGNSGAPTNYWTHDMSKTRKVLDSENKPHVNFANHNPFYFNMERFHSLSVKFDLANDSMIRENLYYNYYEIPIVGNINTIRYGQWDHNLRSLYVAFKDENIKFVCNSTSGYTDAFIKNVNKFQKRNVVEVQEKVQENIEKSDTIIVSFTSWKKRINNCAHIVDLMLNQTLKPDKIILNLSTDEFPNKEEELPKELVDKQDDIFEIFWVKENTRVYKKIIPTLERFPEDVIISIDDDIEYPKNYIEILYKEFINNGKRHPIAAYNNPKENGMYCHSGPFSLVKAEFYGPYLKDLYDNVVMKNGINIIPNDDDIYFYAALLNSTSYKITDENITNKIKKIYQDSYITNKENYSAYNREWHVKYNNQIKIIRDYINITYQKTYNDLTKKSKKEKPILTVMSMTSWTKRIQYISNQIDTIFKTQTILPDIFYLWLSLEEFPNKEKDLPEDLVKTCEQYNVRIEWLPYNDRNFKRWYVYPKHYNDLVISIDDDVIPDKDLVKVAKTHINEVNTIYNIFKNLTWSYDFTNKFKNIDYRLPSRYSNKYMWLGCSIVCPKSFPLESITEENNIIRRKICKRCDESWLMPFAMRNNTKIGYLDYNSKEYINENIQNYATWRILSKRLNGYMIRDYQLYVCLKYFPDNMKKFKELYPKYNTKDFDNLGIDYIIKNVLNE